ncbi:hypothetical protein [Microbispora rosea]|uniref:hypothetical protein n=1 Tax=Microbispora rosea TaxID=58117 RepID=UPI00379A1B76
MTTYEYEPDTLNEDGSLVRGRLARSVTVHDALWTEEDLGWAMGERANAAALCPGGCGHPLEESTDPKLKGEWDAPLPTVCFACQTLEKRKAEYQGEDIDPGHLFHVRRKPPD